MAKIECKKCGRVAKVKVTEAIRGKTIQYNCKNPRCNELITFKIPAIEGREEKHTEVMVKLQEMKSAELVIKENKYQKEHSMLLTTGLQIVGRKSNSKEVDLPIITSDTTISRQHFIVNGFVDKLGGLCFTIKDCESKMGTLLNGNKLKKEEELYLVNNDEISIGKSTIIFKAKYITATI